MRANRVVHGEPVLVLGVELNEIFRPSGSRQPMGKELFLIRPEGPLNPSTGKVLGELVDCWGSSRIEGVLVPGKSLSFTKTYVLMAMPMRPLPISYTLLAIGDGFSGSYRIAETGQTSKAELKLHLVSKDAFGLYAGPIMNG